ncbi:MAG: hypothetical protein JO265_02790, partial [Acidimicrobiia bacterium]|nr:hypothetical protein [Acidimicrobiia bacterium]
MIKVLHLFDLPGANPWMECMAGRHDPSRVELSVASVGPRTVGHDRLEQLGVRTFAFDSTAERVAPVIALRLAALLRRRRPDVLVTHFFWPSLV